MCTHVTHAALLFAESLKHCAACCSAPAALNPKEPQVFAYAVEYIKIRSWGIMAAMLGFVASGSYRGIKDTATPLKAAMIAGATNLVLTPLLIIGGLWVVTSIVGAAVEATQCPCAFWVVHFLSDLVGFGCEPSFRVFQCSCCTGEAALRRSRRKCLHCEVLGIIQTIVWSFECGWCMC